MKQFHEKPTTHLGYITLSVIDLEKMTNYYQTMLGLEVLKETSNEVLLGVKDRAIVNLKKDLSTIKAYQRQSGLYHLAVLLPTMKDFASYLLYVNDLKLIEGLSDHGVSNAVYFTDPEGNGIEVYADFDPKNWPRKNGEVEMVTEQVDVEKLLKLNPKPFTKMSEGTVLGHVHLHVSDLEVAKKFYVDGLGLDLIQKFGGQALFLSYGGYHHHLGLNTWLGSNVKNRDDKQSGIESYTFIYNDEKTLEDTVKKLRDHGYDVLNNDNFYTVKDPFNIKINLVY